MQSGLIAEPGTRVVPPLCTAAATEGKTMNTPTLVLVLVLAVGGKSHVMVIPQLAGAAGKQLDAQMGDLPAQRGAILAVLDFPVSGC